MHSICVTGTTGKLGGSTLDALLKYNLAPASELVICTSSSPDDARWADLKSRGASIRSSNYDSPESMERAYTGCSKLLIVSTPRISMDYGDPAKPGRETHHIAAIRAARKAGVKQIYYTSLGFADDSRSRVMTAHNRTEDFLKREFPDGKGYTVIREGLYNESWPLYFGYFDPKEDERREVVVGGDGPIPWTSIEDLGIGTAMILTDEVSKWDGKTVMLSSCKHYSLEDVARLVSEAKGHEIKLKKTSREEYERHYIEDRGQDRLAVEWWARTYDALPLEECRNSDGTLEALLSKQSKSLTPMEDTVREMIS